ncbi:uncharacterized protein LOC131860326 [Cryptomeria japonica]|uniref:uncharacterized protein LOC131860326 n=1 Tax=Cryptomeria japonica TaxID=3369 RepID=UPI0027DAA425|nr:uncharacterized protein LOC131860326 [Cryptomeria japonica]
MTRFGAPSTIISDNAKAFVGSHISLWVVQQDVFLRTSSNYYMQGNELAKSSNKNLIRIIKRTLEDNQRSWNLKFGITLWANRINTKRALGNSPFMLVYGREARLLVFLDLPSLDLAHKLELLENDALLVRYAELTELEEVREKAKQALNAHQG